MKEPFDIDFVCNQIKEGKTMTHIAGLLGIAKSTLSDILSKPEHSARAREARIVAASYYVEMAEAGLQNARDGFDLQKAKELAHHYRWKAKMFSPREYGDKVNLEHTGIDGGAIKTHNIDLTKLSSSELDVLAKAIGQNPDEPTE